MELPLNIAVLTYLSNLLQQDNRQNTENDSRNHFVLLADRLLIKPLPNDRNMSTQHIATLLGATCCAQQCCDMLR